MTALLTLLVLAQSDSMLPLLERGQVVLVEAGKDGKFGSATGFVLVDAPPETVWQTLNKMEEFKDFVPKVLVSEVLRSKGTESEVHFVIDVPGPDTDYTIRYTRDDTNKTLSGLWSKGDLQGTRLFWKVESAQGGKTLLSQKVSVKNFSAILANVEDEQQTMTVGVNVSSALAAAKAIKRKSEQAAAAASAK